MAQANNSFIVSGRIVRDPEIRLTTKQTKYTFVTLAVKGMAKDKVDFLSICFWEKLADNMKAYCHKGDLLTVCGHISTFKKEDKTETQLIADGFTILANASKKEEPVAEPQPEPMQAAPQPQPVPGYADVFSQNVNPFTPF